MKINITTNRPSNGFYNWHIEFVDMGSGRHSPTDNSKIEQSLEQVQIKSICKKKKIIIPFSIKISFDIKLSR